MEDRDLQELTKRRIEEEVQRNLETKLFRYYRNMGAAVIAVFSLMGISVWTLLPELVSETVTKKINQQIEAPIATAKSNVETVTKDVEKTLAAIRAESEEVHRSLGRLSENSSKLLFEYGKSQAQLEEVRSQAQSVIALTNDSSNASKYFATQDDIARLATNVSALAEQTAALAVALQQLQSATGNSTSIDVTQQEKLTELKQDVEKITPVTDGPSANRTVYIQFAGGSRDDIGLVSQELRRLKWSVPGEERIATAAGLSEVRYFYAEELPDAERLVQDLTKTLSSLGLLIKPVVIRDFSKSRLIKLPRRGVLEAWVEIPAK